MPKRLPPPSDATLADFYLKIKPILDQARKSPSVDEAVKLAPPPSKPMPTTNMVDTITDAIGRHIMLEIVYGNVRRMVEPYEIKRPGAGYSNHALFYGFCQLHGRIHSFILDRIQEVKATNQVFTPRTSWPSRSVQRGMK